MKSEQIIDLLSQKALLCELKSSLKKQTEILIIENHLLKDGDMI